MKKKHIYFSFPVTQVSDLSDPVVSTPGQTVQPFGLKLATISSPGHTNSYSVMVNKSNGGTVGICALLIFGSSPVAYRLLQSLTTV